MVVRVDEKEEDHQKVIISFSLRVTLMLLPSLSCINHVRTHSLPSSTSCHSQINILLMNSPGSLHSSWDYSANEYVKR
ncbi:uncharacterized, partial [Tachysurus ichikawai]